MFADNVFANTGLRPGHLSQLEMRDGCHSLELPLKPDMLDTYVFRRCRQDASGWQISEEKLPAHTLRSHMKEIGEIAGFKQAAKPYCLRYGSGNAFDQNGTWAS